MFGRLKAYRYGTTRTDCPVVVRFKKHNGIYVTVEAEYFNVPGKVSRFTEKLGTFSVLDGDTIEVNGATGLVTH